MNEPGQPAASAHAADVATQRVKLFAVTLAVAALFHILGNPRMTFLAADAVFAVVQASLGVAAVAVLLMPARQAVLLVMCALICVSAWLEAPTIGNHWVLAAAVSLTFLLASALAARGAGRRGGEQRTELATFALFAPAARAVVLVAYGFAAFAKLNSGFFDPAVSCAVYYHDQLVRSWGLGALSSAGRPALGMAVAAGAAVTELSIPLLLLFRRTRRMGVVLALAFHWLLALDFSQHFWDFSSVLVVGFLLFLDDAQIERGAALLAALRDAVRPLVRRVFGVLGACVAAMAIVVPLMPANAATRVLATLTGHAAWVVVGTAIVVVVVLTLRAPRAADPVRGLGRIAPAMVLVPALVLFNGLTPYLGLKTGFAWNMYSNLRTVDGESNHFLVPVTADLSGLQHDRVEILSASDDRLDGLIDNNYEVIFSEFREFAHDYPDAAVTYRRGGEVVESARIGDDEAGEGEVGVLSKRVQSFRVVDTSEQERCLSVFSPAR